MSLPPVFVELRASIGEFQAKMAEAQHSIDHLTRQGASGFDKLAAAGRGALAGVAVGAVAIGGIAVRAALKGELAHAALAQAVKNTGASMAGIEPHVTSLTDHFAKLGFTRDDLERGLAQLTTSLRSPTKAFADIGLAADLASFKHIDLADASLIVAKALEGQLRPLHALGIDLPVTAGGAAKLQVAQEALAKAQEKYNAKLVEWNAAGGHTVANGRALESAIGHLRDAQQRLSETTATGTTIYQGLVRAIGGQASAAAETNAGKLKALQARVENLAERLGNYLIPKIEAVVDWMTRHKRIVEALAALIAGALMTAIAAYIAKQAILIGQMTVLIARTVTYNAAAALTVLRSRSAAAAMDTEALSAKGLSLSLGAVSAAAGVAALDIAAVGTAAKGLSNVPHDLGALSLNDKVKNLYGSFYKNATPAQRAILDAHRGDIVGGLAATQKGSFWDKITSNVHTGKLEKAVNDLVNALQHPGANPRLHNAGFIGPTMAEGLPPGFIGPISAIMRGINHPSASGHHHTSSAAGGDPYAAILQQIMGVEDAPKKQKAHHKSKTTQLIENLRKKLIHEKEAALAAQRAGFLAHERTLQAALLASQEATRRAEAALKLAQHNDTDLSLVNGNVINAGYSFAQLAGARQGAVTHNWNLGGVFMNLDQLKEAIANGLRVDARRNINVGLA